MSDDGFHLLEKSGFFPLCKGEKADSKQGLTKAVVPLVFHESPTEEALELYRTDPKMLAWTLTSTAVLSALLRRLRKGTLKQKELIASYERLRLLVDDWSEVNAIELVKQRAERLLRVHALRAADSLHLGAALVAVQERPKGIGFVSYDVKLTELLSQ